MHFGEMQIRFFTFTSQQAKGCGVQKAIVEIL